MQPPGYDTKPASFQATCQRSRRLAIESLEPRRLLAADYSFSSGDLIITTDNQGASVSVYDLNPAGTGSSDWLLVRSRGDDDSWARLFPKQAVDRIVFEGGGGDDRFVNRSAIPSTIDGGAGNDALQGGAAVDAIFGGAGDDLLIGKEGDDVLHGGDGRDRLYGQQGEDDLYGGAGADVLYGGSSNDGLFGGRGVDQLFGGSGNDRLLTRSGDGDRAGDLTNQDALVRFTDGPAGTVCGEQLAAGAWTDAEIEMIDEALAAIHRRSGSTELLKKANDAELEFIRYGRQLSVSSLRIGGCNSGGKIGLVDATFSHGDQWVQQVVFHEIAHNWDRENAAWDEFLDLSGWAPVGGSTSSVESGRMTSENMLASRDGKWVYDAARNDAFARTYGKSNPYEDFATVFAASFMDYLGLPYRDGGARGDIGAKLGFIELFLDALA